MINRMILQGRLVRDPEFFDMGGFPKAKITVAWSEKYKETETKCFLNCEAWRTNAETLKRFFVKGQEIVIEGRMITEEWEKEGKKQYKQFCLVDKINFCGPKSENTSNNKEPDNDFVNVPDTAEEELPFK